MKTSSLKSSIKKATANTITKDKAMPNMADTSLIFNLHSGLATTGSINAGTGDRFTFSDRKMRAIC